MKLFLKNKQPLADNFDFIKSGLFAYRRNCSEEILSLPSSVFKLISVSWLVLKDTDCGILPPRRVEMWYFLGNSWLLGGYRLWEDKPTTKEAGGGKLNTHKPGSIINCHLCACDQSRCSGLEAVCVCVCVCASLLLLDGGVWYEQSQCRLEHRRLSVALFPSLFLSSLAPVGTCSAANRCTSI